MKKRIISIFLVLSLMAPVFVVPTSAVAALPGGVAAGASSVLVSTALASKVNDMIENTVNMCEVDSEQVQAVLDYLVSVTGVGNLGHEGLQSACNRLNQIAANPMKYAKLMYEDALAVQGATVIPSFELFYKIFVYILSYQNDLVEGWHIINHQSYGYVIVNQSEFFVLCDSLGRYPYAQEITDKWLGSRTALDSTTAHIATNYMLDNLQDVHAALHPDWSFRQISVTLQDGKYLVLQAAEDGVHYDAILCDENGFPYGVSQSPTQAGSDRDYNNDNPDQPEVSDQPIVDIDGDLVMQMFPDGSWTWIGNLLYDASNKTYNLNASTTYNVDNSTYYSFEWNYTYHIDYTSITYIGATEEYTKTYEYYYDLPDGRSSADLTAEDLLALNTVVDVVPYIRSADDTSIRALYHFDGNTRDSSYWNYTGELTWDKGASITYMEANAFNGALYLDETEHDFRISLPSNLSGDFTVQFRYYQSATPTPVFDSSVTVSGYTLVNFSGSAINLTGQTSASLSTGSWNEIAIVRQGSTEYLYLNGVCVNQRTLSAALGNEIRFKFGSEQQTYKYLDELRVLDYALFENGESYTPTSVPYDTNLSLVLPDSAVPVADEYWVFNAEGNLLPTYDFTYYPSSIFVTDTAIEDSEYERTAIVYNSTNSSVKSTERTTVFFNNTSTAVDAYTGYNIKNGGFGYFLGYDLKARQQYVATIMLSDGTTYSFPFTGYSRNRVKTADGGALGCDYGWPYDDSEVCTLFYFIPPPGGSWDVVYMEIVEGTQPNTGHEFVSAIAPVNTDFKTPTLAVRTDLEIASYQIGGVRPSIPEEGLVWALVEDGRITSLQIYNGQAWESVDGRIWTGARWVPYYAYDVVLLKDMYDIVESDPSLDYIYTEAGFWAWLQKAWAQMMFKLDQIILALGGDPNASTCAHVYNSKVDREPGCTEPGYRTHTCNLCGHQYTELIDAIGHDWTVTNSIPDVLDEEGNLVEEGYEELTCSVCGAESRDYGDGPEERDIFDALGDFIADGIGWILEKLTELANSLQQITDIFNGFVEKVKTLSGGFPLFFGAFMALIPEDLATVLWFAVIAFVILCVWKKWSE